MQAGVDGEVDAGWSRWGSRSRMESMGGVEADWFNGKVEVEWSQRGRGRLESMGR
jgi:hypothetical protein